jgi:hypothetical protein
MCTSGVLSVTWSSLVRSSSGFVSYLLMFIPSYRLCYRSHCLHSVLVIMVVTFAPVLQGLTFPCCCYFKNILVRCKFLSKTETIAHDTDLGLSMPRPWFSPEWLKWDSRRTKWHWSRFFPEFFGFPLSVSFHHCSILVCQRPMRCEIVLTKRQIVIPSIPGVLKLFSWHTTKCNLTH